MREFKPFFWVAANQAVAEAETMAALSVSTVVATVMEQMAAAAAVAQTAAIQNHHVPLVIHPAATLLLILSAYQVVVPILIHFVSSKTPA